MGAAGIVRKYPSLKRRTYLRSPSEIFIQKKSSRVGVLPLRRARRLGGSLSRRPAWPPPMADMAGRPAPLKRCRGWRLNPYNVGGMANGRSRTRQTRVTAATRVFDEHL